jgi:hypothetical protein
MMTSLLFSMCMNTWYVATSEQHVCRVQRDSESCTVSVDCDAGSQVIPSRGLVIKLKEQVSLSCSPIIKESIRRKSLSPDGEIWAIVQCSKEEPSR